MTDLAVVEKSLETELVFECDAGVLLKIAAAYNCAGTSVQRNPGQGREALRYQTYSREMWEGREVDVAYTCVAQARDGVYGIDVQKAYEPFNGGMYREVFFIPLSSLTRCKLVVRGRKIA